MVSLKSVIGSLVLATLALTLLGCGPSTRDYEEAKARLQTLAITKEKKIKKYVEDRGSELLSFQVVEVLEETDPNWKEVYPYIGHVSFEYFQTKGKDPLKL